MASHLEPDLAEAWLERARNMGRSIRMIARYGDSPEAQTAASLGKSVTR